MDGLAIVKSLSRHAPRTLAQLIVHGLRDAARALLRRAPHHVPIVGQPGSAAIVTSPGALQRYTALAGPTWRNEVCARTALEVALNRPVLAASRITCPVLIQVGEHDDVAPPAAARRAAARAGTHAELLSYPVDHFDVYDGPWQRRALADQIEFLGRQATVARGSSTERTVA